jgi:hypothetical protein
MTTKAEIIAALGQTRATFNTGLSLIEMMILDLPDATTPEPDDPAPEIERDYVLLGVPVGPEITVHIAQNPDRPYLALVGMSHNGPDNNIGFSVTDAETGEPVDGIKFQIGVMGTDISWHATTGEKGPGLAEGVYDDKLFEVFAFAYDCDIIENASTNRWMPEGQPLDMTMKHVRLSTKWRLYR